MTQSDEVVSESRWSRVLFRIGVGSAIVLSASLVPLIGSGWAGRIKPAVAADDALAIPVQTTGFSLRTSRQILVVFMGSSTCGASTRPEL